MDLPPCLRICYSQPFRGLQHPSSYKLHLVSLHIHQQMVTVPLQPFKEDIQKFYTTLTTASIRNANVAEYSGKINSVQLTILKFR